MTPKRFRRILEAYGADAARWPRDEVDAARALLEASEDARRMVADAAALDQALDGWREAEYPAQTAADIAARASAQPQTVRAPMPAAGRWTFTLVWPNFAGLAVVTAAGFVVGFTGIADPWLFGTLGNAETLYGLATIEGVLW